MNFRGIIFLLLLTSSLAFAQGGPNAQMGASNYSGGIAPSMSDNEALRRILYGQQHPSGGGGAVTIADGAAATLGAKADAKSPATDTTAVTAMQVLKQISASVQTPPSQAVTNAGTFAVQNNAAVPAGTNLIGKVGIDQTTAGST